MEYFKKRFYAYIVDFFVVTAFMWLISYALYLFANYYNIFEIYHYFIFVLPVVQIFYFTILEKHINATVGKRMFYIEVDTPNRNGLMYKQTFVRSISKLYWIPIILDLLVGLIAKKDDRFLSYITRTYIRMEEEN